MDFQQWRTQPTIRLLFNVGKLSPTESTVYRVYNVSPTVQNTVRAAFVGVFINYLVRFVSLVASLPVEDLQKVRGRSMRDDVFRQFSKLLRLGKPFNFEITKIYGAVHVLNTVSGTVILL